jgi:hypothetical protein
MSMAHAALPFPHRSASRRSSYQAFCLTKLSILVSASRTSVDCSLVPLSLSLPIIQCPLSISHLPIPDGNVEQTNSSFVCPTKTASFGPKAPGRPLTLSKHVVQVRHSEVWVEAKISFVITRLLFESGQGREQSCLA